MKSALPYIVYALCVADVYLMLKSEPSDRNGFMHVIIIAAIIFLCFAATTRA